MKKLTSMFLQTSTINKLKQIAKNRDVSVSQLIREAIKKVYSA